jgi:hypothetical protein
MTTPKVREITRGTAHPAGNGVSAPKSLRPMGAGAHTAR